MVFGVERKTEHRHVAGPVLALAQPRADDHRPDRLLFKYPAQGHRRDRHAMPGGYLVCRQQHALVRGPSADGLDEAAVFGLAPVGGIAGIGLSKPALAEEAARQRTVGQQLDATGLAQRTHAAGGAPVQQGKRHLVGGNRQAMAQQQSQMVGVEVRQAQMGNLTALAQARQVLHGIQIARVGVVPPMKLQQVDALHAQPLQPLVDTGLHALRGHGVGLGTPLGERVRRCTAPVAQKTPGDQFGTSVVVCHVEGIEPGARVLGQTLRGCIGVQRPGMALHVGHLPQAGHEPRHMQVRREFDAFGSGYGEDGSHGRCIEKGFRSARDFTAEGLRQRGCGAASSYADRPERHTSVPAPGRVWHNAPQPPGGPWSVFLWRRRRGPPDGALSPRSRAFACLSRSIRSKTLTPSCSGAPPPPKAPLPAMPASA